MRFPRPAGSLAASLTKILFVVGLVAAGFAALLPAPPALAAAEGLTVEVDPGLSAVGEAITIAVRGTATETLTDALLVVRIAGPAGIAQIGQADPALPVVATLSQRVTERGDGAAGSVESGLFSAVVAVPAETAAEPGAYRATIRIVSGGVTRLRGEVWLGKVAIRDRPLDIALLWPVALGVHRDVHGTFFDDELEWAAAPAAENPAGLRALLALGPYLPEHRFTLAVEPILLTQLRDMADGYTRLGPSGTPVDVDAEDQAAENARRTLAAFREVGGLGSAETAVTPYASPALAVLAAEGWRDGFEQLQLGKQELQQSMGLRSMPTGALAPGLDVTTDSLAAYGQASIDHVVVDGRLVANLVEEVSGDAVAVRARDTGGDRVTLVFADSWLSSLMSPPWDAGLFFAGLGARLASSDGEALVVAPETEFALPPARYLEAIAGALDRFEWVTTLTLTEFLRAHPPATRPVLLKRDMAGSPGYVEASLMENLRAAHAAVADLAAAADGTRIPVETALRLLYTGESRWWWRPGASPREASVGLAYAEEARALAEGELSKVSFSGAGPGTFWGRSGTIRLGVENGAEYPIKAELQFAAEGLELRDGDRLRIELPPGRSDVLVNVSREQGPHRLDVGLIAGNSVLDEWSHSVRFVTGTTFVPCAVAAAVVFGVAGYVASRRRRRKSRSRPVT